MSRALLITFGVSAAGWLAFAAWTLTDVVVEAKPLGVDAEGRTLSYPAPPEPARAALEAMADRKAAAAVHRHEQLEKLSETGELFRLPLCPLDVLLTAHLTIDATAYTDEGGVHLVIAYGGPDEIQPCKFKTIVVEGSDHGLR